MRQHFTECPVTQRIINRVHALASCDGFKKPMKMDIVSIPDEESSDEEKEESSDEEFPRELKAEETGENVPEEAEEVTGEELFPEQYKPAGRAFSWVLAVIYGSYLPTGKKSSLLEKTHPTEFLE